jgi:hypothetical protein
MGIHDILLKAYEEEEVLPVCTKLGDVMTTGRTLKPIILPPFQLESLLL